MAIDWDKIEEENKSDFKPYADDGTYEVELDNVTQKTAGTGTIFFEFNFKEDDVQYPKVSRSLFKDEKMSFRIHHYKEIMKVLGASEDKARKAVEVCEGKSNREAIADAYTETFNRLAQKHPKVKIEVSRDLGSNGKSYARSEFADPSIHFSNNNKTSKPAEVLPTDDEVADDLDLDSIPF